MRSSTPGLPGTRRRRRCRREQPGRSMRTRSRYSQGSGMTEGSGMPGDRVCRRTGYAEGTRMPGTGYAGAQGVPGVMYAKGSGITGDWERVTAVSKISCHYNTVSSRAVQPCYYSSTVLLLHSPPHSSTRRAPPCAGRQRLQLRDGYRASRDVHGASPAPAAPQHQPPGAQQHGHQRQW